MRCVFRLGHQTMEVRGAPYSVDTDLALWSSNLLLIVVTQLPGFGPS